jgi:hypothetical protein
MVTFRKSFTPAMRKGAKDLPKEVRKVQKELQQGEAKVASATSFASALLFGDMIGVRCHFTSYLDPCPKPPLMTFMTQENDRSGL